jgi:hypothetical protein
MGYVAWSRATYHGLPVRFLFGRPLAVVPLHDLTADFFADGGQLRAARNDLFIEFRDEQKNLVDVGNVTLELDLTTPDAVMHSIGEVSRTTTPGAYRTTVDPQTTGNWLAKIGFAGPRGTNETTFFTTVVPSETQP